ncbi:hypothetical protein I548_5873 [Mycobacterium intracellulare]|nr:hypothetical protein OCQ_27460 [Mycobacterium paraintracellulare]EUA27764.1 hypothetical protein I548_5873 [Mycobacterium intracellulare]
MHRKPIRGARAGPADGGAGSADAVACRHKAKVSATAGHTE